MSEKFDAMVDDNNQDIYNKAHDPIIIFRANEALKHIGSSIIDPEDIYETYTNLRKELNKNGESLKF